MTQFGIFFKYRRDVGGGAVVDAAPEPDLKNPKIRLMMRYMELFDTDLREAARVTVKCLKRLGFDPAAEGARKLTLEEAEKLIESDFTA